MGALAAPTRHARAAFLPAPLPTFLPASLSRSPPSTPRSPRRRCRLLPIAELRPPPSGPPPHGDDEMKVHRKHAHRPSPDDLLPFDVSVTSPPPTFLGRFRLDPRTHCGDVVEHKGSQFVVKKVRVQYKYSAGKYRVVKKCIEVKSLARKALESYLERALMES